MPPRGFTNPAPKTDSARSALTSFTCTLCNKSYSRHPEYEAHISSYDHQHKKRLRDLKQLSRDPQAAERARRAERKADAEAGLVVVGTAQTAPAVNKSGGGGGGGFKKGGFKSSFAVVSGGNTGGAGGGSGAASGPGVMKKNVLGDDEEEEEVGVGLRDRSRSRAGTGPPKAREDVESDTDEDYADDELRAGGGYYDPRKPTGCFAGCKGAHAGVPVS